MRMVVLQSNYIPWKGYFDLLGAADCFVVYDSVRYTKNDWRNRNRLPSETGPTWLTIPVVTAGRSGQMIREAEVTDGRWATKHWRTVQQTLGKRAFFDRFAPAWEDWYRVAASMRFLHDINLLFMTGLAAQLGLTTPILDDIDCRPLDGDATARLVQLCGQLGADTYVTGPAGLDYLDRTQFAAASIDLAAISYDGYPTYPQRGPAFVHGVSVLDLLANVGPDASSHLRGVIRPVPA